MLTVKGAGGIGKTHTVKKITAALAERGLFSGGIHFIDCEPITDGRQFQFKSAAVFGLEQAEDLWQHLHDHHDGQERLIIVFKVCISCSTILDEGLSSYLVNQNKWIIQDI